MIYSSWGTALAICLSFLVTGVENSADELPEPDNVTLSWNPDLFSVTAQWSKPTGLDADCKVEYTVVLCLEKCPPISPESECFDNRRTPLLNYTQKVSTEKEICVNIRTNPVECGNKKPSKPVQKGISPPLALVKNFTCLYYSHMKMNCTWSLISETSDLQLFYRSAETDSLKPCIHNFTNGPMKRGCHLDDIDLVADVKFFFISGSAKSSQIRNLFIVEPINSVKSEPPTLNITWKDERIYLESSTPDFSQSCWRYKFTYSKCNEVKAIETEKTNVILEYDPACKYRFQAQTIFTQYCGTERESEMSEPVFYGENTKPNGPFMVAVIITPIIVSCFLIVALVLFRRYKEIILPNIPEPSLLFKDMLNSTNDGGQSKSLYVPITEVVERDIRLEPSSTSLNPKP